MTIKVFFIASTIALFMTGCDSSPLTSPKYGNSTKPSQKLQGTNWQLASFGLSRMEIPQGAHLTLTDGRYSGKGGCNTISGLYKYTASTIQFYEGPSTMMACTQIDLEKAFLERLGRVESYVIDGGTLDLQTQGKSLLRFKAQ